MNARTSRLLARVARIHWLRDPRDPRQPESSVLAKLKTAWNSTPPAERDAARHRLCAVFKQMEAS